jgi:hypothetical protein
MGIMVRASRVVLTSATTMLVSGLMAACGSRTNVLLDDVAGAAPTAEGGTTPEDSGLPPMDADGPDTFTATVDSGPTSTAVIAFVNADGVYGLGPGGTNMVSTFEAYFVLGPLDAGCTPSQSIGACIYQSCPFPGLPSPLVSAGTLAIEGVDSPPGGLSVMPDSTNLYAYSIMGTGPYTFFGPGSMLTVTASGGTVPAFTATPIAVPGSISLDVPTPSSSGLYTVDTKQDLAVQWSAGESGAQFVLQGGSGDAGTYFLCASDATLGQGIVPHVVLTPFRPASSGIYGINGQLVWYQRRSRTFTAGDVTVQESVSQYGFGASAAFY